MDILIGLVIGYLIGALFMWLLLSRSEPEPHVIEKSQGYHDMQARRLLAECDL